MATQPFGRVQRLSLRGVAEHRLSLWGDRRSSFDYFCPRMTASAIFRCISYIFRSLPTAARTVAFEPCLSSKFAFAIDSSWLLIINVV